MRGAWRYLANIVSPLRSRTRRDPSPTDLGPGDALRVRWARRQLSSGSAQVSPGGRRLRLWLRGLSPLVVLWIVLAATSVAGIAGAKIAAARPTTGEIEADLSTHLTADYGPDPVRIFVPPLEPKIAAVAAVDRRLLSPPPVATRAPAPRPTAPPTIAPTVAPTPRPTPTPATWLLLFVTLRITNNDGGTLTPTGVSVLVDGSPVSGASLLASAGPHMVGVDARASGYRISFEGACDAAGRVVLVAGQTATCTVILDDLP